MAHHIKLKTLPAMVLIVLFSAALAWALPQALSVMRLAENWTADARMAELSAPTRQNDDIVIVTVTEDTLATLPYRSPLDRAFLGDLLRTLDAAKPRAIGLDILFDQPTEAAKDDALQQTLRNLNAPLRVAIADTTTGLTAAQAAFLATYTRDLDVGYANFVKDQGDGVVRWIYPGQIFDGTWTPGLAHALVHSLVHPLVHPLAQDINGEPHRDARTITYHHQPAPHTPAFRIYPAHLVKTLPSEWFTGRIVLIGADLPLIDRHRTPFAATRGADGVLPGVVIHAHTLAQLLDERRVPRVGSGFEAVLIIVLATLGMILALIDLTLTIKAGLFALSLLAYGALTGVAWRLSGPMLPLLSPMVALSLSLFSGIA